MTTSSCLMTAVAPLGMGAPVIILIAVLAVSSLLECPPANTSSMTFNVTGKCEYHLR